MTLNLEYLSLFCGAGGMDLGFEKAGFKALWANDFDIDAIDTYKKNFNADAVCEDIRNIDSNMVPTTPVVIGGFPCQGFSAAGPRLVTDKRNFIYLEFVRVLEDKRPIAFVAENVKGLLTLGKGDVVNAIINDFSNKGYRVKIKLFNVADYGVPQFRERVILVGIRNDIDAEYFFPSPTTPNRNVVLKDILYGLSEPDAKDICNQPFSSRYMSRNRKKGWDDLSYTIPAMAKQVPLHPSSPDMVKLNRDEWSFGPGKPSRRFSWWEAALVQSFPEDYIFQGNLVSRYKQIGNAVPPAFAESIATSLKEYLVAYGLHNKPNERAVS